MSLTENIDDDKIIQVIKNTHHILKNRGHDITQVNQTSSIELLKYIISKFRDGEPSLDINIIQPDESIKKIIVHHVLHIEKNIKKELESLYKKFVKIHNITNEDELIFIVFNTIENEVYDLEIKYQNLSIFSYKKLLFNLIDHEYVPLHYKLNDSEKVILNNSLMIDNLNQLPSIRRTDPVSRYYNFRRGDVIKIERSTPSGTHVLYRHVVNE